MRIKSFLILTLAFVLTNTSSAAGLKLISVKKIWDAAPHCAFTDLTRFNGKWFCTFRESHGHIIGNGKIRVTVSNTGDDWQSAALLEEDGIDLRDPKLSITPDNRLMLTMGGSVYKDKKLVDRQPRVAFSTDGTTWTAAKRVLKKGDWLWRVTWHKGVAYGTDYLAPADKPAMLQLVQSTDGINYQRLQDFHIPGYPNEATARFLTNDTCIILARREGVQHKDNDAWIGASQPPYGKWVWQDAGMFVGGPNFIVLPDGKLIAAGRIIANKKAQTFVGNMTETKVSPDLILPSGGDCSYPGLVWHDNVLWVTYYSSHEGRTSVYLAKVAVSQ
jgi:hypothetical protein